MDSNKIETTEFGIWNSKKFHKYSLSNNTISFSIIDFGATITSIKLKDKLGKITDVVLGFDKLQDYISNAHLYIGSTVGRFANRIANGEFTLENKHFKLETNNGPNHLHGGGGFHTKLFTTEIKDNSSIMMSYESPDGEDGYPGNLSLKILFTLTDSCVKIDYMAFTNNTTIINLTNHSYFNLSGYGSIYSHNLQLFCDEFTPFNETNIPIGSVVPVEGLYDFKTSKNLGECIKRLSKENTENKYYGYDNNYCSNNWHNKNRKLEKIAMITDDKSGLCLTVFTTQPGIQVYTGNYLENVHGKNGIIYEKHAGLCLETQNFPNAINEPNFPSAILHPGETYKCSTVYKFSLA